MPLTKSISHRGVRMRKEWEIAMPYFFILPAFVLYFLAMSVAIVVTLLYQPAAHLRRYLTSLLMWSSLGFVVSTN
jgi:hypothetical protein